MPFNVSTSATIYKHFAIHNNAFGWIIRLTASGDIACGTITTTTVSISSTSGNIQTIHGLVGRKHGVFENLACVGYTSLTIPEARGIVMGLDTAAAGGIEICADTNQYPFTCGCVFWVWTIRQLEVERSVPSSTQYIDFTIYHADFKGRVSYILAILVSLGL